MRILAIRGENLASLAGCFGVDLERPPLGSVGLFAITGATGAGKSTLLDAMCVALFAKTPRLEKSGGVLVGRADDDPKARLPSNDVRSLLRRGVGSGFAEVDYLGRDGRRYRARWSVHRSRETVNDAYQKQEMNLVDLATELSLGRTKTEREQLVQVEAAAELRPALVAVQGAEIAQTRAATLLDTRAVEAGVAIRCHEEATAALEIEVTARTQALAEREGAQDALRDAARLDLLIEDGRARRDVLITAEQQASRDLARAQEDLAGMNGKIDEAKRHVVTLAAWIAEHAPSTPLVEAWSLCQPALNRYAVAAAEGKNAAAQRHARLVAKTQAVEAHSCAEHWISAAKTALATAEQAWRAADEEAQRAVVTQALQAEGEQLVQRLRRADTLAPIVAQVEKQRARMALELGLTTAARDESAASAREAEECDHEATLAHAAWSEADRALQLARARLDLADRRAELRDDQPCPLCGAHDHPYAREAGPLGDLIADAGQRIHELGNRREGLHQRAATCRANAAARNKAAEEAAQRAEEASEARAALEAQWKHETAAFGVDAEKPDGVGLAVVQAAIAAVEACRDAIRASATQAATCATVARALQAERDVCRAGLEEADRLLDLAATGLSDADKALSECDAQVTQAERDRARALEDIAMALETREDWRAKLDADPPAFAATCAAEVTAFRSKVTENQGCVAALNDLGAEHAALNAMGAERVIATADRTKARAAADANLEQLRMERVALLDGRPTEEVRSMLDIQVKLADERRAAAQAIEADPSVPSSPYWVSVLGPAPLTKAIKLPRLPRTRRAPLSRPRTKRTSPRWKRSRRPASAGGPTTWHETRCRAGRRSSTLAARIRSTGKRSTISLGLPTASGSASSPRASLSRRSCRMPTSTSTTSPRAIASCACPRRISTFRSSIRTWATRYGA